MQAGTDGTCDPCEQGQWSEGGVKSCKPCALGKKSTNDKGSCVPCGRGEYGDPAQQGVCEACEVGKMATANHTGCRPCATLNGSNVYCYSSDFSKKTPRCSACKNLPCMQCDNPLEVKRGWQLVDTNGALAAVMKCPYLANGGRACLPTGNTTCAMGYANPLCAVCMDGYYRGNTATCHKCVTEHDKLIKYLAVTVCLLIVSTLAGKRLWRVWQTGAKGGLLAIAMVTFFADSSGSSSDLEDEDHPRPRPSWNIRQRLSSFVRPTAVGGTKVVGVRFPYNWHEFVGVLLMS